MPAPASAALPSLAPASCPARRTCFISLLRDGNTLSHTPHAVRDSFATAFAAPGAPAAVVSDGSAVPDGAFPALAFTAASTAAVSFSARHASHTALRAASPTAASLSMTWVSQSPRRPPAEPGVPSTTSLRNARYSAMRFVFASSAGASPATSYGSPPSNKPPLMARRTDDGTSACVDAGMSPSSASTEDAPPPRRPHAANAAPDASAPSSFNSRLEL